MDLGEVLRDGVGELLNNADLLGDERRSSSPNGMEIYARERDIELDSQARVKSSRMGTGGKALC